MVRGTREGHPHSCGTAPDFRGGPAGTGFPLIGLRIRAEGHPCPGVFSWCEEYRAAACSASSDSDSPCSAALRSCLPSPTLGARGAPAGTVRWWRPHLDGTLAHEAPRYRSMRMPTRFDRLSAWARVRSVVSQSGGDCFPSGCCAIVGLRQGPSRGAEGLSPPSNSSLLRAIANSPRGSKQLIPQLEDLAMSSCQRRASQDAHNPPTSAKSDAVAQRTLGRGPRFKSSPGCDARSPAGRSPRGPEPAGRQPGRGPWSFRFPAAAKLPSWRLTEVSEHGTSGTIFPALTGRGPK